MRRRLNLLAVLLMLSACGLVHAQTFDLTTQTTLLADLNKAKWRFHPGDDPRWADPSFDDSQWPVLSGRKSWDSQGYKGLLGFGWYRIHVTLPAAQPIAFSGQMCNEYEAFADGRKIGAWGPVGPGSSPTNSHDDWSTVASIPQHTGEVVLAVRVWWWPPSECQYGGFDGGHILLGSPGEVDKGLSIRKSNRLIQSSAESAIGLLYILAGCFALVLYGKERSSKEYLWFGIFTFMTGLFAVCSLVADNWIFISFRWDQLATTLPYDVPHIALILFFFYFIGRPVARFARWVIYLEVGFMLFDLIESATFFVNFTAWSFISTTSEALCYATVAWLAFAYWKQSRSARRLALPLLLLAASKIAFDAGGVAYFAGLSSHLLTPIIAAPVLFRQTDLASLFFLGAVAYVLIDRFAETQAERSRLTGEFEAARSVQQMLIPAVQPVTPGFMVESVYLPAQEVGGDFFLVVPSDDGSLLIVTGDVSGKGLQAAMVVSTILGALRNETARSPAAILANLNQVLIGQVKGFVTCTAALIAADGRITLANAGNPAPYLNGRELAVSAGLPLGMIAGIAYDETAAHLAQGDLLTFVSDGVVEATAPTTRELFGFDRTQAISRQAANSIAEAASTFGLGAPQADDITVLTVARV